MPSYVDVIKRCRQNLKAARANGKATAEAFQVMPSLFYRFIMLLPYDRLRVVLKDQHILWTEGCVVWGCLVQANDKLFNPRNGRTMPANIIYDPTGDYDGDVPDLLDLAGGLFGLKNIYPKDKEIKKFAAAITNEMQRTMHLPLPKLITEDKEVIFTTTLINPGHLPGGYLAAGFFPVLICPEETEAAMILPSRFWPKELVAVWRGAAE